MEFVLFKKPKQGEVDSQRNGNIGREGGIMTQAVATSEGIGIIKIAPKKTECPHCKFLYNTFLADLECTSREYYLMTEVFVYLHGGDVCNYSTENKIQPLEVKPIEGIKGTCQPFKATQD